MILIRRIIELSVAALSGLAAPAHARAAPAAATATNPVSGEVAEFYSRRQQRPLWFASTADGGPEQLLRLLASADVDGIARKFDLGSLLLAVRAASDGDAAAIKRAELALSQNFVDYARELQKDPRAGVIYVDADLKPRTSAPLDLLQAAAAAPSLGKHIAELSWMHPLYGQLRSSGLGQAALSPHYRNRLTQNLLRVRALPRTRGRYVLVNTANQRLYMYDNGQVSGEMKVVAGRPNAQTALMNAYIRFAVLNPYWNVPADLVAKLAPNVIKRGGAYLNEKGYQVVADFNDAQVIDAATIDWKAVAAGTKPVQMRQLPGPTNSMGRVKFMFPNSQGVWLHDTPSRHHFAQSVRLESAGCIRLEDAWRLGSWLFEAPVRPIGGMHEKRLELSTPVPVFITYLTAVPRGSVIDFVNDAYQRDLPPLVQSTDRAAAPGST